MKKHLYNKVLEINNSLLNLGFADNDIGIFWEDCIATAMTKNDIYYTGFCHSLNAKKLAIKLNSLFDIKIKPEIKRLINYKTGIKFLMKDENNKIYFFKATVLDFISSDVEIELNERFFTIK